MEYIEFAGPPGTGKTTILKKLLKSKEKCLSLDEVYADSMKNFIQKNKGYLSSRKFSSYLLKSGLFFLEHKKSLYLTKIVSRSMGINGLMIVLYEKRFPGSLKAFEEYANKYNDSSRTKKVLERFNRVIEKYMVTELNYSEDKYILVDEGFVQRGSWASLPPQISKEPLEEDIQSYCDNILVPDKLFLFSADSETCNKRMEKRRKNRPAGYESLASSEFKNILKKWDESLEIISDILSSKGCEVIKIDSEQSIGKVKTQCESKI